MSEMGFNLLGTGNHEHVQNVEVYLHCYNNKLHVSTNHMMIYWIKEIIKKP